MMSTFITFRGVSVRNFVLLDYYILSTRLWTDGRFQCNLTVRIYEFSVQYCAQIANRFIPNF